MRELKGKNDRRYSLGPKFYPEVGKCMTQVIDGDLCNGPVHNTMTIRITWQ